MPTTIDSFTARRAQQAADQADVNRTYAETGTEAALHLARALAKAEHADHRQFDGHWDGWTLGIATSDVHSKGGDQALRGDLVLFKLDRPGLSCTPSHSFYSVRLGWNCSAGWGIEPVEGWKAAYEAATR